MRTSQYGTIVAILLAGASPAAAAEQYMTIDQPPNSNDRVIIPRSTSGQPGDRGVRARTHYEILNTHGPITPPGPRRPVKPTPDKAG